jgi:hypothetical protein
MKKPTKTKKPSKPQIGMGDLVDQFMSKYETKVDTMDSDDIDWICYFIGYRGVDQNRSLEFFLNDNPIVLQYILDYIVANANKDWKSSFKRSLEEFDDLDLEAKEGYEHEEEQEEEQPSITNRIKRFWNAFYYGSPTM